MTNPVSNNIYSIANGTFSTSLSVTLVTNRAPTANDVQFPVQKRWINSLTDQEYFLLNFSSLGGVIKANWIPLAGSGGGGSVNTLEGNSGGFISPMGGNINIVGDTTTINIVGNSGTSTLTANVILPSTPHQVLVGETSSIVGITPGSTSGVPLISQGLFADPLFGTALVAGGGTGKTSFTPYAVVTGGTTSTANLQDVGSVGLSGQVLTSSGAAALPSWQNIPSSNFAWTDSSGTFNAVSGTGYFITNTSTATLPVSPSEGNTIAFIVDTANFLTIMGNSGQFIGISGALSIAAGTAVNNSQRDSVTLVYRSATTTWEAVSVVGNWTVT